MAESDDFNDEATLRTGGLVQELAAEHGLSTRDAAAAVLGAVVGLIREDAGTQAALRSMVRLADVMNEADRAGTTIN